MTRTDILQLLALVLGAAATALVATDRRLVRTLWRAGADRPQNAKPLTVRSPLTRLRFHRLCDAGVIVQVSDGWCYLDTDAFARYRRTRRQRAFVVLAVMLPAIGVFWWVNR
jgi:hypothetical protein